MSAEPEHHHIFELFDPSKFIQAYELQEREHTVTITQISGEEIEGEEGRKSRKPVLHLAEWQVPFVLNKTNAKVLIKFYGADYRQWVGKRFTMFPTQVKFGKETVDAIRIRPTKPSAASAPQQRAQKSIAERVAAFKSMLKTVDTVAAVEELWGKAVKLREEVDAETLDALKLAYEGRIQEVSQ